MNNTPKQFVLYKDNADEWRWYLLAGNGRKIADSAEGYNNLADARHGASLVAGVAASAPHWNASTQQWLQ